MYSTMGYEELEVFSFQLSERPEAAQAVPDNPIGKLKTESTCTVIS